MTEAKGLAVIDARMGLRDILKKKDRIEDSKENKREVAVNSLQAPEFTFIRSDTHTQEIIHPPSARNSTCESQGDTNYLSASDAQPSPTTSKPRRLSDAFRSNGPSRGSSVSSRNSSLTAGDRSSPGRRLSQRLRLSRAPASSENVPADLPEIITTTAAADDPAAESQWEKRATLLAKTANENEALHRSAPPSPVSPSMAVQSGLQSMRLLDDGGRADPQNGVASSPRIDADIQQAIKLHEEGELEQSTQLFGMLADPKGANNPLSQVLYGLALR